MKRFSYYFFSAIVVGFIVLLGVKYQIRLNVTTSIGNLLPLQVFQVIFPIIIGFFLGIPKLITKVQKRDKQCQFDWTQFIAISIPTLAVLIIPFLSYTSFTEMFSNAPIWITLITTPMFITIAGLVLGFVLLDSFKKADAI